LHSPLLPSLSLGEGDAGKKSPQWRHVEMLPAHVDGRLLLALPPVGGGAPRFLWSASVCFAARRMTERPTAAGRMGCHTVRDQTKDLKREQLAKQESGKLVIRPEPILLAKRRVFLHAKGQGSTRISQHGELCYVNRYNVHESDVGPATTALRSHPISKSASRPSSC